jgi:hypothetical protein
MHGWPRSGFSDLGNMIARLRKNEKQRVGVHRLPHLKIEMWATQLYWADMGHPPDSVSRSLPVQRDGEKHTVDAQTAETVIDVDTSVVDQSPVSESRPGPSAAHPLKPIDRPGDKVAHQIPLNEGSNTNDYQSCAAQVHSKMVEVEYWSKDWPGEKPSWCARPKGNIGKPLVRIRWSKKITRVPSNHHCVNWWPSWHNATR